MLPQFVAVPALHSRRPAAADVRGRSARQGELRSRRQLRPHALPVRPSSPCLLTMAAVGAPAPPALRSDPSPHAQPPPFTLEDVRRSIPGHCWEKQTHRSVLALLRDVALVAATAAVAIAVDSPWLWPLYALVQGTTFWALFVVGHDCGHGSFSPSRRLNDLFGHVAHTPLLVPYHGWRISHRRHHAHHGHVHEDESWHPLEEHEYRSLDRVTRMVRCELPLAITISYPIYLFQRTPGRRAGSHFLPSSPLFRPTEAGAVLQSTAFVAAFAGLLTTLAGTVGARLVLLTYGAPYVVFVSWLAAVTYLHHTDMRVPWFRGPAWSFLRGGLSTTDRDYGRLINQWHHHIGTHVVHHLFPRIPHYHLVEATRHVKPVLGEYYFEPERATGPLPWHLLRTLRKSFAACRYVDDHGEVVYYQRDVPE